MIAPGYLGSFCEDFAIAVAMQNGITLFRDRKMNQQGDLTVVKTGKRVEVRSSRLHRSESARKNITWSYRWDFKSNKRIRKTKADYYILVADRQAGRDDYYIVPRDEMHLIIGNNSSISIGADWQRKNKCNNRRLDLYKNKWKVLRT